jgi:hypothetical protein
MFCAAIWEIEPKRLTATFCPLNCATVVMFGCEYIGIVNVLTIAAIWMTSPPESTLLTTAGPARPAKLDSPASIAWTIAEEAPS